MHLDSDVVPPQGLSEKRAIAKLIGTVYGVSVIDVCPPPRLSKKQVQGAKLN
ncbi:hypothetical protein [Mogibacterium diversum]|uniref:hypothetical protein n=1 Tax=Mogibacterium diversum TaxID=114527 RepID=UPI00131A3B1D|nr:hypothetical protein [Mogibacterium diversum]